MIEKQGEQGTTKEKKPKKDPCIGCYYALNHECAIDIKGYCPREKHFDYENANIQQKDFAPKIEQNPTDNDMVEALRTEYEKGRADAFAQMKREWSEEDENKIETIIQIYHPSKKITNWLKSLKDRYNWKPSDEQMEALGIATDICSIPEKYYNELSKLYFDLKKLTE